MARKQLTKEQILDALQTHKTVQKAAKALGVDYPEMQYHLRKNGIVAYHTIKENDYDGPTEDAKVGIASRIAYMIGRN